MFYIQNDPTVDTSGSFFMEAVVRFVSGSSSITSRAPSGILFTTAPTVGNVLYIGADEVFFNAADLVKGPTALVDTDDSFHTYRIEVAATGSLALFYDGNPILTGQTFASASHNGLIERILWGDVTTYASGTSEWASFKHDALVAECPVPEPSSSAVMLLIGAGLLLAQRRRKQFETKGFPLLTY
jgi:hypothetical protein